jgi:sucrose-6F-phosphate phosphohydrolase
MINYPENKFENFLATDLDGTLVGNDQACHELFDYLKNNCANLGLAYITGRHYESAGRLIEQKKLPAPDFLVSDVGTVIHFYKSGRIDELWRQKMNTGWQPDRIREVSIGISGIIEQNLPDDCRISFTTETADSAARLERVLKSEQIPHKFVFSSNRDIDILPAGGGKGEALRYIVSSFVNPSARILAAGDSGNDSEMLTAGYPSVIVANAQSELVELSANINIFRATREYAAGILEAWRHFYE